MSCDKGKDVLIILLDSLIILLNALFNFPVSVVNFGILLTVNLSIFI